MKLNIFRALGAILLFLSAFSVAAHETHGLLVTDPWVRAAPPVAPTLAAYMILENHSSSEISVVDVRASLEVDRIEMHRTTMADGMMKMAQQKLIPVAPYSATELKPGSWHIMLIGPEKVPTIGEVVHLTLVLSDGSEQVVAATVRQGKMTMEGHDHVMKTD